MPDSTASAAGLFIDNTSGSIYTKFAVINCAPNYRLNIHVANAGEVILFGFRLPLSGMVYNLRKPNGTIALSGTCPYAASQTGYLRYFKQAMAGPFPQNSGYIPLSYAVSSPADTGDYYFEIANAPAYTDLTLDYWDFQVVSGAHNPPLPSDTINGRVWSKSWQLYADLGNFTFQPFNGKFFVYSDDRIVTKLAFSNAHVGAVTIFCNPYGCLNTGNFANDRRSVNSNTFIGFPGIAQYKVFLNNPDSLIYPSGSYGQITGIPYMISDPAFPPCSPEKQIVVSVSKPGIVETTIIFPYGSPATNVDYYTPVISGINNIPWNGLDGLGSPVPPGTLITVMLSYVNGLTNLPIWDQERNPDGYAISLVRPTGAAVMVPMTYWDDSQLSPAGYNCPVAPQSSNFSGCTPGSIPGYPGCHPWGVNQADCHDKMINTWWYSSASTAMFTTVFSSSPLNAVGHDSTRCGVGTVMLSATVQPQNTVWWWDSLTGGNLLLAGDTIFITPPLNVTTTFYAEARNAAASCISAVRTPVVATILPLVQPILNGPSRVCEATGGHIYSTQPGMLNYLWNVTAGGQITSGQGSNEITVTWTGQGEQSVRVSFTDPNGCRSPEPGIIHVTVARPPGPAGPVTGPTPLCKGSDTAVYSVDPVPEASVYMWTLLPGMIVLSGAGTNSITVQIPQGTVSGSISVYAVNFCGQGAASPPLIIEIQESPQASAGIGDTLCRGTVFIAAGAYAQNYSGLHWFSSGQGMFSDAGILNPVYTPSAGDTGTIILSLVAYAFPPCANDTASISLLYNTQALCRAGEDATVCEEAGYVLTTSSADKYTSIQWTGSGTGIFSDPAALHPQYNPSMQDIQNGQVILTLTTSSKEPCAPVSDSMLLLIQKAPSASAGTGGVVCGGTTFRVSNATASDYSAVLWTHNGKGTLSGSATLQPEYTPSPEEAGEVTLTLKVTGITPCNDSVLTRTLKIIVYKGVTADAGPAQLIPDSSSAVLNGSAAGGSGAFAYLWEPASLLVNPSSASTETLPLTSGTTFMLKVQDLNSSCSSSDTVRIDILVPPPPPPPPPAEDCIVVHNVITPNGDGLNDRLVIDCIDLYPDNTIKFFTRWGVMIKSFEHYDNKNVRWDGTNEKGEPLPDGTYYYVLTIKQLGTRSGWVFIRDGSR